MKMKVTSRQSSPWSNGRPVEHQKTDGAVPGEDGQQIYQYVSGHDDAHQIGDAEAWVIVCEPVHGGIEFFHNEDPPSGNVNHEEHYTRIGF